MHGKRILIVSGSYPHISCGVSRHVDIIARRLAVKAGFEVAVLTSDDPTVDSNLAENYTVYPRVKTWNIRSAGRICREILSLEPDVVHIQNPTVKYSGWNSFTMSRVGPLLKRMRPRVRLVVMQHDVAIGRPCLRRRYGPLFRASDAITVSNQRDYQAVRAQSIAPEKIYITPVSSHIRMPPSTPERKQLARRKLNISTNAVCVAYFGYIQPSRNIDVLIRALSILGKHSVDLQGIIIGGPFKGAERYYEQCKALARRTGLEGRIIWTGYATEEEIMYGLLAADIFVSLPQRGADLRNTSIISAFLAELPVVTTRNEKYYIDYDLEHLEEVYISKIEPEAVSKTILRILENSTPLESLRLRRKRFDPDKIWQEHVKVNILAYGL